MCVLCGVIVCVMIALNEKRTWIGGLLDHVIEMVLAVLKEFSWCCSNVREIGRNGDTVWCVFKGVPSSHCCLLLIHTHGGGGSVFLWMTMNIDTHGRANKRRDSERRKKTWVCEKEMEVEERICRFRKSE